MTEYVIWSMEHGAWWRPGSMGYCATLAEAGRYEETEAARIVASANIRTFNECMIPVAALVDGTAVWRAQLATLAPADREAFLLILDRAAKATVVRRES